jgi:hypothetical protein
MYSVVKIRYRMLEHKNEKLLPLHHFLLRLAGFIAAAGIFVLLGLFFGVAGYHWICGLPWIDAILNASMILTGMGPVDDLHTTAAKLFASGYALFSGLVFITVTGMVLVPIVHRVLHIFHLETVKESSEEQTSTGDSSTYADGGFRVPKK